MAKINLHSDVESDHYMPLLSFDLFKRLSKSAP